MRKYSLSLTLKILFSWLFSQSSLRLNLTHPRLFFNSGGLKKSGGLLRFVIPHFSVVSLFHFFILPRRCVFNTILRVCWFIKIICSVKISGYKKGDKEESSKTLPARNRLLWVWRPCLHKQAHMWAETHSNKDAESQGMK